MPRINKNFRFIRLPLILGGGLLILTTVIFSTVVATGEATFAAISIPFFAMAALSVAIIVLMGVPILLLTAQENAAISRLVDGEHWARFPQYSTDSDWRSYAERQYEEAKKAVGFSWAPIIIVTVMIALGGGVPAFSGAFDSMSPSSMVIFVVALGTAYALIVGGLIGAGLIERRDVEATYRRRLAAPIPNVTIGRHGLYDDDRGYQEFGGLNTKLIGVKYKEASPSSLRFKLISRFGMYEGRSRRLEVNEDVKVLADHRTEAQALAERFEKEGLIKK